jgi:hypothetical protein
MQSRWFARLFFLAVAALAIAGVASGTACTRWGQPGPVTPTVAPLSRLFVDANTGSDTTGNGSVNKPYKSVTKAVAVLDAAKSVSPSGVTITLASGDYNAANGEKFPIVVSKTVAISGSNYGGGSPKSGSFINGLGEDSIFEQLVHAPAHTAYSALEVVPPAILSFGSLYVGATKIKLPSSRAFYASLDVIGAANGTLATFGAGIVSALRNVSGVIVPGGSFTCGSCLIHGNDFGIGAFAVPIATASPSGAGPSVTLNHPQSDSAIAAKVVDILTDGNVSVSASGTTFELGRYAFADAFTPIVSSTTRGTVDFGGGLTGQTGGNVFIGARVTEFFIVRRGETISALDDTWNPNQQRANRNGQYPRKITFASGATGKNVTIRHVATGSTVTVGPAPVPTPTPSTSPSASPTASPT